MRTHLGYRLLSHLTLALSCIGLVQAESIFMPELQFALIPLLSLVLVAFFADGRWILPTWGANLLGLIIAAGDAWWMAFQLGQIENPLLDVPLPAALVPYFGPLLMALLVVLLFRPRSPGYFWLVQGIGLLQVVLACVLVTGTMFGWLMTAYLASSLGCLILHHLYGDLRGAAPAVAARRGFGPIRFGFWLARWTCGIGLVGLTLFLLTPRAEGPVWNPNDYFAPLSPETRKPAKTGLSEEINLNRSGSLELDEDVAFVVSASYGRGRPKTDLPADQRWRSYILARYDSGRWVSATRTPTHGQGIVVVSGLAPDFGKGQYFLSFTVSPRQVGGFVLADPVRINSSRRVPVTVPGQSLQQVLYFDLIDAAIPNIFVEGTEYRYTQVVPPPSPGDDRRAVESLFDYRLHTENLVDQYPAGLERWTADLLRRLAANPDYGLEGLQVPPVDQLPSHRLHSETRDWERIARALERYLARSGEYTYSLDLRHQDPSLDPVLDFLFNVRQGHCECYATALALMLRSVGIPAQVVKGYRGAESQGDGTYLVRNRDVHSWVEAMVESLPPDPRYAWLTLDPTPETEAPPAPNFSVLRWLQDRLREGGEFWKVMVLDYDAEQQANVWDDMTTARGVVMLAAVVLTLAIVVVVVLLGLPRLRLRRLRARTAASFYGRMVALLARRFKLEPQLAQTPREYSAAASRLLQGHPVAATLAALPGKLAELFYRVRFGGQPLSDAETRAVEQELLRLAAALRR